MHYKAALTIRTLSPGEALRNTINTSTGWYPDSLVSKAPLSRLPMLHAQWPLRQLTQFTVAGAVSGLSTYINT